MADDTSESIEKKVSPHSLDRAHSTKLEGVEPLHEMMNEYLSYHGKALDKKSGLYKKKSDILTEEVGDIVKPEADKLREDLLGKEHDEEAIAKKFFELGKKAFLAQEGVKNEKAFADSIGGEAELKKRVKDFITAATQSNSYEEAMARVLEEDKPYDLTESNPLALFLNLYGTGTHESKELKDYRGNPLKVTRREYLKNQLVKNTFYKEDLKQHGRPILRDYGYKELDFSRSATNEHVLNTIETLVNGEEIKNLKSRHFMGKRKRETPSKTHSENPHDEYEMAKPAEEGAVVTYKKGD